MAELTFAQVDELLKYDPKTGKLFWKPRTPDMFNEGKRFSREHACAKWNTRYAGEEALTAINNGGFFGTVYAKSYLAHRIAWLLYYGEWPTHEIDHINGVRADNRIENLRDVTHRINLRNQKRKSTNKTGFSGISKTRAGDKWCVRVRVDGSKKTIGTFATLEDAISARQAADKEHGYHPNHGRD